MPVFKKIFLKESFLIQSSLNFVRRVRQWFRKLLGADKRQIITRTDDDRELVNVAW